MMSRLLVQDVVITLALLAALLLMKSTLARKLSEKMDTMKVQRICRRLLVLGVLWILCFIGAGSLYQYGVLTGIAAYVLVGAIGFSGFACLQVFRRLMR